MDTKENKQVSLAKLISDHSVTDIDGIKCYLAKCSDSNAIDLPDRAQYTALMVACQKGRKDLVTCLLENGANPNLKRSYHGDTPLHYACQAEEAANGKYRMNSRYQTEQLEERIGILEVLFRYGAIMSCNIEGLSPADIAALHTFQGIVDFFAVSDKTNPPLTTKDKVKAYELLGVTKAVFDKDFVEAKNCFEKAESHDSGLGEQKNNELFAECFTHDDDVLQQMADEERRNHEVLVKAFLIGERSELGFGFTDKFYEWILFFAYGALFQKNLPHIGFSVFKYLIGLEVQDRLDFGSVLKELESGLKTASGDQCAFEQTCILLKMYQESCESMDQTRLDDFGNEILESFGNITMFVAYCQSAEHLSFLLEIVEGIFRSIKKSDNLSCNITQAFFDQMLGALWDDRHCGQSKESREGLKYAAWRLLCLDSDVDDETIANLVDAYRVVYDFGFILFLSRALVRYGYETDVTNERGTPLEILQEYRDDLSDGESEEPELQELFLLVSPPNSALRLEELAIRVILRNGLKYREQLPVSLCDIIEDGMRDQDPADTPENSQD